MEIRCNHCKKKFHTEKACITLKQENNQTKKSEDNNVELKDETFRQEEMNINITTREDGQKNDEKNKERMKMRRKAWRIKNNMKKMENDNTAHHVDRFTVLIIMLTQVWRILKNFTHNIKTLMMKREQMGKISDTSRLKSNEKPETAGAMSEKASATKDCKDINDNPGGGRAWEGIDEQ